jgi:hypothetical protein
MAAALFFKKRRLMLVLPRQFGGKTELGVRLAHDMMGQQMASTGMFIAKDHKSAKRATREKHLRIFEKEKFQVNTENIIKKADPRTIMNIVSVDKDPDRIRGGTNHFVHWSEAAFAKFEHGETHQDVFGKIIDPTTKLNRAYTFIETTLNGKNGFHDMWENADSFGFARLLISLSQMYEMGLVTKDDFETTMRETHPLVFRQEYECEFITFQGRAYDEFEELAHVAEVDPPQKWQQVLMSVDWGFDPSATCVLFGYVRDKVLYVFDEIYEKRMLPDANFDRIDGVMKRWSIDQVAGVADHEEDRIVELNLRGIPVGKADKANVMGNRMEIKEMLWKNRIVIDPRCRFLIRDLETATWQANRKGESDLDYSQCTYGHFDAEAALRYLVRELGKFEIDEPEFNPHTTTDQTSARAWALSRQRDGEL